MAGRRPPAENTTPRIPEHLTAPLITAAVFYVETAAADLLAAGAEIARLRTALPVAGSPPRRPDPPGSLHPTRRDAGRASPRCPARPYKAPGALISDGSSKPPAGT